MAIYDLRTSFGTSLDLTGSIGTHDAGDVIDLTETGLDIGDGTPKYVNIYFTTAVAPATSAINIQVQLSATEDQTGDVFIIGQTGAITSPDAGDVYSILIPPLLSKLRASHRYLGITIVVTSADVTAGAANVHFSLTPPTNTRSYPDAVN